MRKALLLAGFLLPCLADAQTMLGFVEPVRLMATDRVIDAKIDTGADHSSIHSPDVKPFERNGKPWLSFSVPVNNAVNTTIQAPVLRTTKIKRLLGISHTRYVVALDICIAGERKTVATSLTDRTGFQYPMLIGRSALGDTFIVSPSQRHLTTADCPE